MKYIFALELFVLPGGKFSINSRYHLFNTMSSFFIHFAFFILLVLSLKEHGHIRGFFHLSSWDATSLSKNDSLNKEYNTKSGGVKYAECVKGRQEEDLIMHQKQPRELVPHQDFPDHHRLRRHIDIGDNTSMPMSEDLDVMPQDANSTLSFQTKSSKSNDPKSNKKSKKSSMKSKSRKPKNSEEKPKQTKQSKVPKGKQTKEPKCKKNKKPRCKKNKCTISTLTCVDDAWLCEHKAKTCKDGFSCKSNILIIHYIMLIILTSFKFDFMTQPPRQYE